MPSQKGSRSFLGKFARAFVALAPAFSLSLGCSAGGEGEIEIAAPVQEAPVHNPTKPAKHAFAEINPDNEAKHIDRLPGAVAK